MQQNNQNSRKKLDRQKIDNNAIINDVNANEIKIKREIVVLREKRRLAHFRQKLK
jgi:hypothetical protein